MTPACSRNPPEHFLADSHSNSSAAAAHCSAAEPGSAPWVRQRLTFWRAPPVRPQSRHGPNFPNPSEQQRSADHSPSPPHPSSAQRPCPPRQETFDQPAHPGLTVQAPTTSASPPCAPSAAIAFPLALPRMHSAQACSAPPLEEQEPAPSESRIPMLFSRVVSPQNPQLQPAPPPESMTT